MRIASSSLRGPKASEFAVYLGSSKETLTWLRRQVVDFVGLHLLHDMNQTRRIDHITIVQHQPTLSS
jgi:hypothetical protein